MARLIKRKPDTGTASVLSAKDKSKSTIKDTLTVNANAGMALNDQTLKELKSSDCAYRKFFLDNDSHSYAKLSESHEIVLDKIHKLSPRWNEISLKVKNAKSLQVDYMPRLKKIDVPKVTFLEIFGPSEGERELGGERFPDIFLNGAPELERVYLHGCGYCLATMTYTSLRKVVITGVHLNLSDLYYLPISAPLLQHLVLSRLDDPDCGENLPSSLQFDALHRLCIYHGKGSAAFLSLLCAPSLSKLQIQNIPLFSASDLDGYAQVLRKHERRLKFSSLRTLWFGIQDGSRGFADEDPDECWREFASILRRVPILEALAFVGSHINCCTEYINRFCLDRQDTGTDMLLPELNDLAVIRLDDPKIEQSDDYLRAALRFVSERKTLGSPLKTLEFTAEDWNAEDWAIKFPFLPSMETVHWGKPSNGKIRKGGWVPREWGWVWTRSR